MGAGPARDARAGAGAVGGRADDGRAGAARLARRGRPDVGARRRPSAGWPAHGRPLAVGEPANLLLLDPAHRAVVDPAALASRSRNSPYAGRELPGRVVATFLHGDADGPGREGEQVTEALLVLEDGRTFRGEAYGAVGTTVGEAVFATGMTGYQETLTDPSYAGQVVVMTAPHIGNTGVNGEDDESSRMWVAGFVVRDPARRPANWRATGSLDDELAAQGVVGISGIDTRALTRHLRERGAMRVGISSEVTRPGAAARPGTAADSMVGADLAPGSAPAEPYVVPAVGEKRFTIAALDLGIKTATPRHLAELGVETHVLPATATRRAAAGRRPGRRLPLHCRLPFPLVRAGRGPD